MDDQKPAALTLLHRVLIASAIVLGVLFTAFSAYRADYLIAAVTAACTFALGIYLRWFLQKTRT